jgi:hypothetical protein
MTCYILDDQYGESIYTWLAQKMSRDFPVRTNILNPLIYIPEIMKVQPEYILLDNYFPHRSSWRDESLGDEFMQEYIRLWLTSKIICISDYGKTLIDRYDGRAEAYTRWYIYDFIDTKDPEDIQKRLERF